MNFKIENSKIAGTINLLSKLSLKGKQSRHRSKMIKDLNSHLKDVAEQEQELLKEHCYLDENDEPKKTSDGQNWDVKDVKSFVKDRNELYEEIFVLEGGNVTGYLKTVKEVLLDSNEEWSGSEAELYDYLCDELERVEEQAKGA
jgi:hypothetical protein